MAEWLRRWTRNPMGSPRAGSNPARSEHLFSLLIYWFFFIQNSSMTLWLRSAGEMFFFVHYKSQKPGMIRWMYGQIRFRPGTFKTEAKFLIPTNQGREIINILIFLLSFTNALWRIFRLCWRRKSGWALRIVRKLDRLAANQSAHFAWIPDRKLKKTLGSCTGSAEAFSLIYKHACWAGCRTFAKRNQSLGTVDFKPPKSQPPDGRRLYAGSVLRVIKSFCLEVAACVYGTAAHAAKKIEARSQIIAGVRFVTQPKGRAKGKKKLALAGNRTRVNCLEGSYAHHYTTNAHVITAVVSYNMNPIVVVSPQTPIVSRWTLRHNVTKFCGFFLLDINRKYTRTWTRPLPEGTVY